MGQAARRRRRVINVSVPQGCGSVLSLDSRAGSGLTLTTTAGSRPRGTTRQASPDSRVRCATLSVCVIWQCGVSVIDEQLQLAPVATLPEKLPTANGLTWGAPAPKCRGPAPEKSTAIARLTPRSSAARTFCPAMVSSAIMSGFGLSMTVPHLRQVRFATLPKKRSNTGGSCVSILVTSMNSS